ncbi:GNAT family N-acetyltransferase [Streptococcus moroccensis]|uniref:RimJ/RimL family protein N-acetyltransferase n=1 Tax=Streptococcus moroccensis TaxID=1451356 RepID=A0ABT9YVJ4_9STRE|nr:GNAT family protein [Streptococcus moroccensis]MDQ0223100.1 RimJ/RimL family protein N-acetyltransferase [Streptococcus moroccensis]
MAEAEVIFKEAQLEDAAGLAQLLMDVATESEFLTRDDDSPYMTAEETAGFIKNRLASPNQICLIAKVDSRVVGVLNIAAASYTRVNHIGDIFIAIAKDFWGYGLGQILMEEAIDWAEHSGIIRRLELTVQARNERAVHLYQKCGFRIEGTKERGAKTKNGEFLDVYLMGKLIDDKSDDNR